MVIKHQIGRFLSPQFGNKKWDAKLKVLATDKQFFPEQQSLGAWMNKN